MGLPSNSFKKWPLKNQADMHFFQNDLKFQKFSIGFFQYFLRIKVTSCLMCWGHACGPVGIRVYFLFMTSILFKGGHSSLRTKLVQAFRDFILLHDHDLPRGYNTTDGPRNDVVRPRPPRAPLAPSRPLLCYTRVCQCVGSVQNHESYTEYHYFGPKDFTKWKIILKILC